MKTGASSCLAIAGRGHADGTSFDTIGFITQKREAEIHDNIELLNDEIMAMEASKNLWLQTKPPSPDW